MRFPVVLVVCLLTPVVVTSSQPRDCHDVYLLNNRAPSGVHTIYPSDGTAVQVYCDMDTDGGKWTVFQRRMDGTELFVRRWEEYKRGFGTADGEYWLGLESLYHLTEKRSELRVDMEDFSGNSAHAEYRNFYIDSEDHGYMLHLDRFTDGGAGDSLSWHNGQRFSTLDRDQDSSSSRHCARLLLGGFWYNDCAQSNPNGVYLWGDYTGSPSWVGVEWYHWKGYMYSLKSISMKVRPQPRREEQDGQTDE